MTTAVPELPSKLILECPGCGAQFDLTRYVPDRWVRCPKCRAAMSVPIVEAWLTDEERRRFASRLGPARPSAEERVAQLFPVGRLMATAGALGVLVAAGIVLFALRASRPPERPEADASERPFTNAELKVRNSTYDFPMWLGYEWVYALAPDAGGSVPQEERKVLSQAGGPEDVPQFELAVAHPKGGTILSVRLETEGVYLLSESRGGRRWTYEPALPLLRFPLLADEVWTYTGACVPEGGGEAEAFELDFRVSIEPAETGIGKRECFRVDVNGTRGGARVEETSWYAPGIGLMRRTTKRADGVEDARLVRYRFP